MTNGLTARQRVKAFTHETTYTAAGLALGVSHSTVHRAVNGKSRPKLEIAAYVARIIGRDIDEVFPKLQYPRINPIKGRMMRHPRATHERPADINVDEPPDPIASLSQEQRDMSVPPQSADAQQERAPRPPDFVPLPRTTAMAFVHGLDYIIANTNDDESASWARHMRADLVVLFGGDL